MLPLQSEQVIGTRGKIQCPTKKMGQGTCTLVPYPESDFGTTIHRVTHNNPDGIQSHCTNCRGGIINPSGIECYEIEQQ